MRPPQPSEAACLFAQDGLPKDAKAPTPPPADEDEEEAAIDIQVHDHACEATFSIERFNI